MGTFSAAFLAPLTLRHLHPAVGDLAALALAALGVAAGLFGQRSRATFALLGVALYVSRGRGDPPEVQPIPSGPVVVHGVVASPPRTTQSGHSTLRLESPPRLALAFPAPRVLPGMHIRAHGRGDPDLDCVRVLDPDALTVIDRPPNWSARAAIECARLWVRERLVRGLSTRASNFLEALLLGSSLGAEEGDRFARTGTLHLFAVSGLHLSVLLGLLRLPLRGRPIVLLASLAGYAALTGFRSPVTRALVLGGSSLLGNALGRRPPRGPLLAFAATVVTALDPSALRSAGFQLSFAAYAGIAYLGSDLRPSANVRFERRIRDAWWNELARRIGTALRISTAAFVASAPTTVIWFHRLAPIAIPASVALAPAIPLLLVCAVTLVIWPAQPLVLALTEMTVESVAKSVEWLDRWPGAGWSVPRPSLGAWLILACATTLWLIVGAGARRAVVPVRAARTARWLTLAAVAALPLWPNRSVGAHLLHARQGAALLIVGETGTVLIDAGPASARVADQVLELGVRRLDLLLLSHEHQDHVGGAPEVEARLSPRRILRRPGRTTESSRNARQLYGDVELTWLWPPIGAVFPPNDASAVVLARTRFGSVLATGDLETRSLAALMGVRAVPRCDVLVLPHHGGWVQGLADLLAESRPSEVWIPALPHQPAPEVRLLLEAAGFTPVLPDPREVPPLARRARLRPE